MKMRKILAILLCLVLVVGVLASCSNSTDDGGSTAGTGSQGASSGNGGTTAQEQTQQADSQQAATVDTSNLSDDTVKNLIDSHTDANGKTFVTVSITDDPGAMNPYASGSSKPRQVVLEGIYEGMFMIQGTGGPLVGCLAESYDIADDGVTVTIKLKDYAYDQKGNPFSAHDVVFVMEEVARKEFNSTNMNFVESVTALDDYTVQIVFTVPYMNRIINWLIGYMFTEASYKASPDSMITTPVGTGPYAMTEWVSGASLTFEYTGDYWEKDTTKIYRNSYYNVDKIIYKVIKDAAQRVIALEAGELDMSSDISATDLGNFQNNDNYNVFSTLRDQVVSLFFNSSENSPLHELELRQAVAYAIDAQGVINGVDQGNGVMCHAGWANIFPDYKAEWDNEDYYNYNRDKAVELLEKHGYGPNGQTLDLLIMFENNDRLANVAQVVQGYLLDVNINLDIFPCDGSLFNTYKLDNTKADILMATCGSSTWGASSFIGNLRASADDKSLIGITDLELVEKIDLMCENAYEDWSYSHDLHYYVKDNCYLYCLYAPINFIVTTKVVTGLIMNQKGMDSPNCCNFIWNDDNPIQYGA